MSNRKTIFMYKKHSSLRDYDCFYCNDYADQKDHIPAISYAEFFNDNNRLLVRCCLKCNIYLSNRPFINIHSRFEFLIKMYSKKFKRILSSPDWNQDEIEELSGSLKSKIIINMKNKRFIENKIKNLMNNAEKFEGELSNNEI